MALISQIEAAARIEKPRVGAQAIDREPAAPQVDEADRRQFAIGLCAAAIRHTCNANEPNPGDPCTHRHHKRDLEAARKALILAGLAPDPYPSVERERRVPPGLSKPTPEFTRAEKQRLKAAAEVGEPRPDLRWRDQAACDSEPLNLFFGKDGEKRVERKARERLAAQVCARCPVRTECLDYAVSRPERFGTWGGMGEEARASERRRRQRRAAAA